MAAAQCQVFHIAILQGCHHAFTCIWPSQFSCWKSQKYIHLVRQKQKKSTYDNQSHENEFTKATPPFPSGLCDNETQQREVLTFTSWAHRLSDCQLWCREMRLQELLMNHMQMWLVQIKQVQIQLVQIRLVQMRLVQIQQVQIRLVQIQLVQIQLLQISWSPNSTDLYFWYLYVNRQIQKT